MIFISFTVSPIDGYYFIYLSAVWSDRASNYERTFNQSALMTKGWLRSVGFRHSQPRTEFLMFHKSQSSRK